MICKTQGPEMEHTLLAKQEKPWPAYAEGLLLIKSCRSLKYENPGRVQRLAGADNMLRLSGFVQLVIDSLHPFLQLSSRQTGAEVKKKAILSATLSAVAHKMGLG